MTQKKILSSTFIETPQGRMLAIADEKVLYLLEFDGRRELEKQIKRLKEKTGAEIIPGTTPPLKLIENELKQYFKGTLTTFKTPITFLGTPFQKQVWEQLKKIPHGKTKSYLDIAVAVGKPTAYRAVAQVNANNRLAVIVPCHRVINASGALGGYAGGLSRKQCLLDLEQGRKVK